VTFPARLIRLGFWIKNIAPQLKTPLGWWRLFCGLLSWIGMLIWSALPFAWRAEFRRGMHGTSTQESFKQEAHAAYAKEVERKRRQEEEELRRLFRKMRRFVKGEAQANRNPFEQGGTPDSSQYSQNADPEPQASHQSSTNDFQRQQQERAQRDRAARQQAYEQANAESNRANQKQQSQQKEADAHWGQWNGASDTQQNSHKYTSTKQVYKGDPSSPLSQAFYERHRADFESVNWVYSPEEEVYSTASNKFTILGVSSTSSKAERKKAYHTLSKKYGQFTSFDNPSTVSERANAIIKVINDAKIDLIDKFKDK